MHYDVFNGDADGILALVQLRLAKPVDSIKITGVKRDISLLSRVDASNATSVTVLDISLEKNVDALNELLSNDIPVEYVDHHRPGNIPESALLNTSIDTDPNTCTSLIVNRQLDQRHVLWAIAAAFGDNMIDAAMQLAQENQLSDGNIEKLKSLGIYVNYNAYGRDVSDLHIAPEALFEALVQYENPLALIAEHDSVYHQLAQAYKNDFALAKSAEVLFDSEILSVIALPDEAWARRISGVFGNDLANQSPDKAHAVLTINADDTYTVSLRAPLNNKQGAGDICAKFKTGGGRSAAAGINKLVKSELELFIQTVTQYYNT